jgi:hypothetical protein
VWPTQTGGSPPALFAPQSVLLLAAGVAHGAETGTMLDVSRAVRDKKIELSFEI